MTADQTFEWTSERISEPTFEQISERISEQTYERTSEKNLKLIFLGQR